MRNLISFIRKIRFLLFFVFLQFVAFFFISNGSGYQKASIINSANELSGWFYSKEKSIEDYFTLQQVNNKLLLNNLNLKQHSIKNYQIISDRTIKVEDTLYKLQYEYYPAQIIKNSVSSKFNILTLNAGSNQGVEKEMGVLTSRGVVGFIKDVSANYSTVMPVMNQQFRLTAKSTKENLFGTFLWRNEDSFNTGTVEKVPNYIDLKNGDTMVTTTQEGIFPAGEPLGIVTNISEENGSNYKTVKLKLTNDFYNLNHVLIVKNILKQELDSLNLLPN